MLYKSLASHELPNICALLQQKLTLLHDQCHDQIRPYTTPISYKAINGRWKASYGSILLKKLSRLLSGRIESQDLHLSCGPHRGR